MMRGLFGGLAWGAILGLVMLVIASLLLPPPGLRDAAPSVADAPPPRPTVAVSPATPFVPDEIAAPGTTPDGRSGAPAVPRAGSAAAVAPDAAPRTQEPAARPVEAATEPETIEPPPEDEAGPVVSPVEEGSLPAATTGDVAEAPAPEAEAVPAVEAAAEALSDAVSDAVAEALAAAETGPDTPAGADAPAGGDPVAALSVALAASAVDAGAATRAPNAAAAAFIPAAVAVPPAAQTAGSGAPEPEAAPQAEPAGTDALAGSEASSETRAAAADTLAYATADPVADPVSGTPTDVAATVEVAEDGASGAMTAAAPLADEGGATASSDTADAGDAAAASASDALQAADADVGADTAGAPLAVAAADPAPEPAPAEPLQTDAPAEASAEPLADAAEAPDPAVPPVAAAESAQANPDATTDAPTGIGQPTGSFGRPVTQGFGNRAESVRINRLPRIGEAGAEADALSEDTAASAETLALPDDAPALDRFAAEFENPEGRPLVAVVLIDIGAEAGGIGAEALATIPFPVTLAIPADAAGAADAAAAYRKAGFEVAMIPGNIPELASPSDVEVAFEVFRSAVSETVAVLEPLDAGFQSSRAQAEQVVAILDETGQGLISFDRGLNNALGAARRAGLPAITVSRDLDADGSDPEELRRSLDRAAFRAEQEGAAVVVLRSRPQSVSTLYAWALEGRAEGVALAPVSAVFRAAR
jgi:polysaccharide deacetylase 2 family uncharacterized protein YibQ